MSTSVLLPRTDLFSLKGTNLNLGEEMDVFW